MEGKDRWQAFVRQGLWDLLLCEWSVGGLIHHLGTRKQKTRQQRAKAGLLVSSSLQPITIGRLE